MSHGLRGGWWGRGRGDPGDKETNKTCETEFEDVLMPGLEKVSRVGLAAITSLGARFHSGTVLNPAMNVLPFG